MLRITNRAAGKAVWFQTRITYQTPHSNARVTLTCKINKIRWCFLVYNQKNSACGGWQKTEKDLSEKCLSRISEVCACYTDVHRIWKSGTSALSDFIRSWSQRGDPSKKIFFHEQKSTGNGGYSASKLGVGNRFLGYLCWRMSIGDRFQIWAPLIQALRVSCL